MLSLQEYQQLQWAYDRFNRDLFADRLDPVMITLNHRGGRTAGFYSDGRFAPRGTEEEEDPTRFSELSLVPERFPGRTDKEILSTLVHEMCHHYQCLHGSPSRSGYHNREWADIMLEVGLVPSDTGAEGGKMTGQSMTHYIEEGGIFDKVCDQLIEEGFQLGMECIPQPPQSQKKDKVKYTCHGCGANVWGKPGLRVLCASCEESFEEQTEGQGSENTY